MKNLLISTRFYIRLLKPPLCLTENVFIEATNGQAVSATVRSFSSTHFAFFPPRLLSVAMQQREVNIISIVNELR